MVLTCYSLQKEVMFETISSSQSAIESIRLR